MQDVGDVRRPPLLADILVRKGCISERDLDPLLARQRRALQEGHKVPRLGAMLQTAGLVTEQELAEAVREQDEWRECAKRIQRGAKHLARLSAAGSRGRLDAAFREYHAEASHGGHLGVFRDSFIHHGGAWEDWHRLTTESGEESAPQPPRAAEVLQQAPTTRPQLRVAKLPSKDPSSAILYVTSPARGVDVRPLRLAVEAQQRLGVSRVVIDLSPAGNLSAGDLGGIIDLVLKAKARGLRVAVVPPEEPYERVVTDQLSAFGWCYASFEQARAALADD